MTTIDLDAIVRDTQQLVRFPTVSAEPGASAASVACAQWLCTRLAGAGLSDAHLCEGAGPPVVVASWWHSGTAPTVVFHAHYDVQPTSDARRWSVPPFAGRFDGRHLWGRGAADDKGPLAAMIGALRQWTRSGRAANLRVLVHGDEEIGSPTLARALAAHRGAFTGDMVVVFDTVRSADGTPTLTVAQRGEVTLEVVVRTGRHDLHGGRFAGVAPNAATVLARLLAGLHDERGSIAVPGVAAGAVVRAGAPAVARPAIEINGVTAGYQGPGPMHIIPARASAKVNVRLVPGQDPAMVDRRLRAALARRTPAGVRLGVHTYLLVPPWTRPAHSPWRDPVERAVVAGAGRRPVDVVSGATSSGLHAVMEATGTRDVYQIGFGRPSDRAHGPDERVGIDTLVAVARTVEALGARISGGIA